jgi:hypothetical protein
MSEARIEVILVSDLVFKVVKHIHDALVDNKERSPHRLNFPEIQ